MKTLIMKYIYLLVYIIYSVFNSIILIGAIIYPFVFELDIMPCSGWVLYPLSTTSLICSSKIMTLFKNS